MRFWRGDYETLQRAKGTWFAEAFGERDIPSVYDMNLINQALISQAEKHPDEFARAAADPDPHIALIRESMRLDIPFWSLAYGLSVAVATSFTILEERGLDAVLRLGDIEDHVVEELARRQPTGIHASTFDRAAADRHLHGHALRSWLCDSTTGKAHSYPLLLAGVPIDDIPTDTFACVMDAIILGAVPAYAVQAAKVCTDPATIADASKKAIAVEYLGAL